MASPRAIQEDSVPGEFFVDRSCIDCGTCYQLVPEIFAESEDHARVHRQPLLPASKLRAEMALVSCPTGSIGTLTKHDLLPASHAFPTPFEDDVFFCGFTSRKSFGGWSWLIRRADGNVLVDSPRAARPILDRIDAMGGVRFLVLTHGDDVADHEALARHFGCERVMHARDVADFDLHGVERVIEGDDDVALAPDLVLVPTPGHTRGHMALVYDERCLFSGDHLWGSPSRGFPTASRTYCWHSWSAQLDSIERLLGHRFRAILPGHGPVHRTSDAAAMQSDLRRTLDDLRARSKSSAPA